MNQIRPARMVDLPGVGAVLAEAFSDKLRIIFGSQPEKIQTLLEAMYAGPVQRGYDGVLVADLDGRVVGTTVIQPTYTPQENRLFESIAVRELGLPRMLRASFMLWLLGHNAEPDEAYISDVGVASDCQGQGIAQEIMQYADNWAYQRGYKRLTLWVAESNAPAIHVYEKTGFSVIRTRSSWLTRLVFGIRRWHLMEKRLDE
jgi:ribosomal protein S18 acetylase RimI-like enzyme